MRMRVNQQWSPLVTSDGGGGDLSQGGIEGHQNGEQQHQQGDAGGERQHFGPVRQMFVLFVDEAHLDL